MSIFAFRRTDDDQARRLAELERAHQHLARQYEATDAQLNHQLDLLWRLACPVWLSDLLEQAKATGWLVSASERGIVVDLPEAAEHRMTIELPLSADSKEQSRIRADLQLRLRAVAVQAA